MSKNFDYKFAAEHMQGVKTTGNCRVRFMSTATLINAAQDAKIRIARDESRTDSERRALMRKLRDELSGKLSESVKRFGEEVVGPVLNAKFDAQKKALGTKSLVENLQLFAALKGAMPQGADLKSLIMSSKELASCAASLPDEVLAANKLSRVFAQTALEQHFPEIGESQADYDNNFSEYERIKGLSEQLMADLNERSMSDSQAATRVDEKDLFNTSLPEPKTAAEEAQRREELAATQERLEKTSRTK